VTYQIILGNLNKFNEQMNVAGQKVLKIDEHFFRRKQTKANLKTILNGIN
jgi:hypothetical protein